MDTVDYTLTAEYSPGQPDQTEQADDCVRLECKITIPQQILRVSAAKWLRARDSAHRSGVLKISNVKYYGAIAIVFTLEIPNVNNGTTSPTLLRQSVVSALAQFRQMIEGHWSTRLRRRVLRSRVICPIAD